MSQSCSNCRHMFTPLATNHNDKPRPACRRYPPQTHFLVVLRGAVQPKPTEEQRSAFPPVMPDWYCGEYAPQIGLAS
jgi:hypothetical protein